MDTIADVVLRGSISEVLPEIVGPAARGLIVGRIGRLGRRSAIPT